MEEISLFKGSMGISKYKVTEGRSCSINFEFKSDGHPGSQGPTTTYSFKDRGPNNVFDSEIFDYNDTTLKVEPSRDLLQGREDPQRDRFSSTAPFQGSLTPTI